MDMAGVAVADIARGLQYMGAAVLFGSALSVMTNLPTGGPAALSTHRWARPLFAGAGLVLLVGAILSLIAQSASMTGVTLDKVDADGIKLVLLETQWGHALAIRTLAAVLALGAAALKTSRLSLRFFAALGGIALISFAFTGHGVDGSGTSGLIHLISDSAHSLAAGVWLGALIVFLILVLRPSVIEPVDAQVVAKALAGFSSIGTAMVAVLVASGLLNSYFMIGWAGVARLFASTYGLLLIAKVVIFGAMLLLAALNRYRLTPALEQAEGLQTIKSAVQQLRKSLILETLAGTVVIAVVSVLGMLEPPGVS